jgi:hypothetical protein
MGGLLPGNGILHFVIKSHFAAKGEGMQRLIVFGGLFAAACLFGQETPKPAIINWYAANKDSEPMKRWDEAVRERVLRESESDRIEMHDIYRLMWCYSLVDLGETVVSTGRDDYSGFSAAFVLYKASLIMGFTPWDLMILQSVDYAETANELQKVYEWSRANGVFSY